MPLSGTPRAAVLAEKVNVIVAGTASPPAASCEVKFQTPGVGSKPVPSIVPVPRTFRKLAFCNTIDELDRLKVKVEPPKVTDHNAGVGVEGLKIYVPAMLTGTLAGIALKLPVLPEPVATSDPKAVTRVVVAKEVVSNVALPPIFRRPVMGTACAEEISPIAAIAARIANRDLDSFIIVFPCSMWCFTALEVSIRY